MMRLWIRTTQLPETAIVRGVLAGQRVLAEQGVTLPACFEAFSALARKEVPPLALAAFDSASHTALRVAFGAQPVDEGAALVLLIDSADGTGGQPAVSHGTHWSQQDMHAC